MNEYLSPNSPTTINDDDARQPSSLPDPVQYTLTVAEALQVFLDNGCSTTERTIQRYCHSGKLDAMRVNPDSREVTEKEAYIFLINPISVSKRISIAKEQQEFSRPTVVAASHDMARHDVTAPDNDAATSDTVGHKTDQMNSEEIETLKQKVHSLEIDKAVRDKMIEHYKEDRKVWHEQAKDFVNTISYQSRELGSLEAKLTLTKNPPKELPPQNGPEAPKDKIHYAPTVDIP